MTEVNHNMISALHIIRDFVTKWLESEHEYTIEELVALKGALNLWRREVEHRLVENRSPESIDHLRHSERVRESMESLPLFVSQDELQLCPSRLSPTTSLAHEVGARFHSEVSHGVSDFGNNMQPDLSPIGHGQVSEFGVAPSWDSGLFGNMSPRSLNSQAISLNDPYMSDEAMDIQDFQDTSDIQDGSILEPILPTAYESNVDSYHGDIATLEPESSPEPGPSAVFNPSPGFEFESAAPALEYTPYSEILAGDNLETTHGSALHSEVSSPHEFTDLLEDLGLSLHVTTPVTAASQSQSHRLDPLFALYIGLAQRYELQLPQMQADDAIVPTTQILLHSLTEEYPLPAKTVHNLLYTLLPGPLVIVETHCYDEDDEEMANSKRMMNGVAIIRGRDDHSISLLLLETSKDIVYIIGDEEEQDLITQAKKCFSAWRNFWDWEKVHIKPREMTNNVEHNLLCVYIAECCFNRHLPILDIPSSRDLRLRFLRALVSPCTQDSVLTTYGIPNLYPSKMVDVRQVASPHFEDVSNPTLLPMLEHCDVAGFNQWARKIPTEISFDRCLRILQCVNDIGSPSILRSLKLALTEQPPSEIQQALERPIFEKLFHIHMYLDKQEVRNHLLVARSRFVKYCYYATYLHAVEELSKIKRSSAREQHSVAARRATASYKQGIYSELPATPSTDRIDDTYHDLTEDEKKRRAPDMVKNEIAKKVAKAYNVETSQVKKGITRYIREGRVLHLVLQGGTCLNPALLILFPSQETDPPSLDLGVGEANIGGKELKSLRKPIKIKDIDGLTQAEAGWCGRMLQTRPALLKDIPKSIFSIISGSTFDTSFLQVRDPEHFRGVPLSFFE